VNLDISSLAVASREESPGEPDSSRSKYAALDIADEFYNNITTNYHLIFLLLKSQTMPPISMRENCLKYCVNVEYFEQLVYTARKWKLTANFSKRPEFSVSLFFWSPKYCADDIDFAFANFLCASWLSSGCNEELAS